MKIVTREEITKTKNLNYLTTDEVNTSGQSLEHVSRIAKRVDGETETHQHDEHAYQRE